MAVKIQVEVFWIVYPTTILHSVTTQKTSTWIFVFCFRLYYSQDLHLITISAIDTPNVWVSMVNGPASFSGNARIDSRLICRLF